MASDFPHEAGGPASTPDQPVQAAERLVSLDFIRGIAVLGILFANITAFGHPMLAYYWPGALPDGGNEADRWVWLFQFVAVDGKFRGLFSILFGAGMMLFIQRVWARGDTRWLQARRLFWLLLFGLAHFYLLFIGDILFLYAMSGFAVLGMLHWSARKQFWWGLIWYLLGSLVFSGLLGMQAAMEAQPEVQTQPGMAEQWQAMERGWEITLGHAEAEAEVLSNGSYGAVLDYRFTEQSGDLAQVLFVAVFETIPLLLLGMALYRFGFFSGGLDPMKMRKWGWASLIGGTILSGALGWWVLARDFPPFLTQFVFNGASTLPRFAMIIGLAALLAQWAPKVADGPVGSRFVAAGRMAFSNYIGTSLVMLFIFQSWAGGLYGDLHRLALLPIVLVGWALMLLWSKPWLARFRYGPLEWLWRCLTYFRLFPFRR
ncbi:DUF418 domain-containing protein [Altericroceibacterium endophyticum]|uniref:DUF418 domain-containing protein n=1 Tax=Altericroceibacterium endophyticum TaxID=1808508 RepID=A0A6I4T5U6_9SPHN|nr:DUF418 domain-containing protein [Altericroceibacterium endophyticum]MXO66574.1 DUF418 domain-containing protein [Altericroceibacterium endophyticum]